MAPASDSLVIGDLRSGRLARLFGRRPASDLRMFPVFRSDRAQVAAVAALRGWIVSAAGSAA